MVKQEKTPFSPKEFAAQQWPTILAGTLAGGALLLLIRYYKNRQREHNLPIDEEIPVLESEATYGTQEIPVLAETGITVIEKIPDAQNLAKKLSDGLEGEAQKAMQKISNLRR